MSLATIGTIPATAPEITVKVTGAKLNLVVVPKGKTIVR